MAGEGDPVVAGSREGLTGAQRAGRYALALGAIAAVYAVRVALQHGLSGPLEKDERFFWPASLVFSHDFGWEALRGYGMPQTPLAFVLFGTLQRLFHGGPAVARALNLLVSFGMLAFIAMPGRAPDRRSLGCAVGLAVFPYYLGLSGLVYTDFLAAAFVLLGLVLHRRGAWTAGAVAFALAIATRQLMVAFPLAVAASELRGNPRAAVPPLLAASTTFAWIAFFGGLTPVETSTRFFITTREPGLFLPSHALYFLACLGAYHALPGLVLAPRRREGPRAGVVIFMAVVLGVAFLAFPPLGNFDRPVVSMGVLDIALRKVLSDPLRIGALLGLAVLACARYLGRLDLTAWIVLANAVVLAKAHVAWDKHALPVLVVLWYLSGVRSSESR